MKIISRYKDYYDHISHLYGEDPLCTYDRAKIDLSKIDGKAVRPYLDMFYFSERGSLVEYEYIVAGKYVIKLSKLIPILDPVKGSYTVIDNRDPATWAIRKGSDRPQVFRWEPEKPKELISEENLYKLIKIVGVPVFRIQQHGNRWFSDDSYKGRIAEEIPNLSFFKVPSLHTAEDMWKNISHTITTVLRDDVDKQPPHEASNEGKILTHGFDLKTSFRHRK